VSELEPPDLPIPELRTERLRLRGWRDSDLDAYAAIAADEETMRWVGGMQSRSMAWRALALYAGHWALRGYGLWAVEHGGELVGRIGLWRPEGWLGLELGWLLASYFVIAPVKKTPAAMAARNGRRSMVRTVSAGRSTVARPRWLSIWVSP